VNGIDSRKKREEEDGEGKRPGRKVCVSWTKYDGI
jgi:hypothetical protein